ncbi:MAG TPA: nitrogen fixation protein NifX [Candidatus Deferrimicrobiaceae bacterium]
MKVAFTSSNGETVDLHFGHATKFQVWEVGPETAGFLHEVAVIPAGDDEEDRIAARANAVAGCAIVYTVQIGGPPAAKLVSRKIQPMKTGEPAPIAEIVRKLQQVLRGTPPPWLRKAMHGGGPAILDEE